MNLTDDNDCKCYFVTFNFSVSHQEYTCVNKPRKVGLVTLNGYTEKKTFQKLTGQKGTSSPARKGIGHTFRSQNFLDSITFLRRT